MCSWRCLGNAAPDPRLGHTYAPEIFYFNGTFYLIGSPKGEGHYLFTSDSPAGPFKRLTGNLGLVIDGSMIAGDDGTLYFTHAEYPSIHGHRMDRDGVIHEAVELRGTSMGHWTEGPGIFKRGGLHYITMTGNHLLSRGYRVDYAISEHGPLGPYRVPRNKTLLVDTRCEYGSLGHSSSVIGPDLDSFWIFYHSFLLERDGRRRGYRRRGRWVHMDRMLFCGDELQVSGPTLTPCPVPEMPDFYGWADQDASSCLPGSGELFLREDDFVLSAKEMSASGTAEVTLVPGSAGAAVFAYRDNARFLWVEFSEHELTVRGPVSQRHPAAQEGQSGQLEVSRPLFEGFRLDVLHTVRLECAPEDSGQTDCAVIMVDNILPVRIPKFDCTGRVGSKNSARTSYVAFSRHVNQSGDRLHYQYVPGFLSGLTCMPSGRPTARPFRCEDGEQRLLIRAGESLSYRINAGREGEYHLQAVLQAFVPMAAEWKFADSRIPVSPPDQSAVTHGCKKIARMEALKRVELGKVTLAAGPQEWSLTMLEGEAQVRGFDLFPARGREAGEYEGLALCRKAAQIEGEICIDRAEGLQMDRPGQVLCQFGDRFNTDGFIETDIIFHGDEMRKSAGVFLRISENSAYPDQVEIGHRGYYIGFNGQDVFIWRMNFDKTVLVKRRCPVPIGAGCRVRAEMRGNAIAVYLDGVLIADVYDNDSLPFGLAAVGSFGARVTFTRVKYELY
jgi:hypothetical protein